MVHTVYALNPLSKGANYCTIQQLKEHCMAAVQRSNQSEYTVRRPYHEVHVIISITNQRVFVFRQLKISQPISNTLNHTTVCKTNIMTAYTQLQQIQHKTICEVFILQTENT